MVASPSVRGRLAYSAPSARRHLARRTGRRAVEVPPQRSLTSEQGSVSGTESHDRASDRIQPVSREGDRQHAVVPAWPGGACVILRGLRGVRRPSGRTQRILWSSY
jgi:hypothetical protein